MKGKTVLQEMPRSSRRVKGSIYSRNSSGNRNSKCGSQAAEFACSGCVCCVLCPIAVVWCCIVLPCKIGWRAVQTAANWACSCGSCKQVSPEYSSFSDIDSDRLPRRTNSSIGLSDSKSSWHRCVRP